MKAVIIDDEPKARRLLEVLLIENFSQFSELFLAQDLIEGVELIKKHEPQLVFLDIEMPEYSGIELFNFIDPKKHRFELIFTTAYNNYAIKAFELSAVDYLLKPLQINKLKEAVEKAIVNLDNYQISLKLDALHKSLKSVNFKKIALPVTQGIKFVNFEDIILFKADGMYTRVALEQSPEILISKPLKHFVNLLDHIPIFYKPHRSYLINLTYIKEYIKKEGGYIVMENDETVSISNDKKEEFLMLVKSI